MPISRNGPTRPADTAVVQKPFDQFAKRLFTAAWEGTGVVQTDAEILVDSQFIDVWFEPDPARDAERAARGLMGAMGREVCGVEVFRNTPDALKVAECQRKQLTQLHTRALAAERAKQPPPALPPAMWVLSSGHPTTGMEAARVRPMEGWPRGFYEGGWSLMLRIVVLSELPVLRDTLVLRLFAKGKVREAALLELAALPEDAWEREVAMPALANLHLLLSAERVTYDEGSEEEQFLMTTQNLYEEWARKTRQEGYEQCERETKSLYEQWSTKLVNDGIQKGLDDGIKKGRLEGIQEGERGALTRLFAKRLGRALTETEQQTVAVRHEKLGLSRLEDVALELRDEALAAWLADLAGV